MVDHGPGIPLGTQAEPIWDARKVGAWSARCLWYNVQVTICAVDVGVMDLPTDLERDCPFRDPWRWNATDSATCARTENSDLSISMDQPIAAVEGAAEMP